MSALFAPEGINVKDAHQTFKSVSTDSFNVTAEALRTNPVAAFECLPCLVFSRNHGGRENSEKARAEQGGWVQVDGTPFLLKARAPEKTN